MGQSGNFSKITSIAWCAYKIDESKVCFEETIFIDNSKDEVKDADGGHESNGLVKTQFGEVIKKFTDFVFREIIMQNYAFKIMIEGDWVMQLQI